MQSEKDRYDKIVDYIVENQEHFYRIAFTYTRNKEDALDVVQNAVCKALQNYKSLRSENALKAWFYRILINESKLFLRKAKRRFRWSIMYGKIKWWRIQKIIQRSMRQSMI